MTTPTPLTDPVSNVCSCSHQGSQAQASTSAIRAVLWYQRAFAYRLSPCRFFPSCSNYSLEALQTHGTVRGLWLTVRRLSRCRPFGPSGIDLVPAPRCGCAAPAPRQEAE